MYLLSLEAPKHEENAQLVLCQGRRNTSSQTTRIREQHKLILGVSLPSSFNHCRMHFLPS